jgi:hypothetical protein
MDRRLLRVFQQQVALQSEAVIVAAGHLNNALAEHVPFERADTMRAAWIAIQNLLTSAGNVSKALWGQGGRLATQREPLRASLGVDDASAFRNVLMRNHFEHYDERVDRWWAESEDRHHLDLGFQDGGEIVMQQPLNSFRVLELQTLKVVFWGERFELRPIVREAERILPIASAEGAKHLNEE